MTAKDQMRLDLWIPSESDVEEFKWPLLFAPGTTNSDRSKCTPAGSEEDIRTRIAEVLGDLRGPFVVAACEAVCRLLSFQGTPKDDI